MIEKLNPHYSFTSPASVHDEEALTALEVAGRQGAKINEVIETVNRFGEKVIPETVNNAIDREIKEGTFNEAISTYVGGLQDQVDDLLSSVPEGSTTMDAEIIDARRGQNNINYSTLGYAIRGQLKEVHHRVRNICVGCTTESAPRIAFDVTGGKVTLNTGYYIGSWTVQPVTTAKTIDFDTTVINGKTWGLMLTSGGDFYLSEVVVTPRNPSDLCICIAYVASPGSISKIWASAQILPLIYVNGEPYVSNEYKGTANCWGQSDVTININETTKAVELTGGFLFWDNAQLTSGSKWASWADMVIEPNGETLRVCLDSSNRLVIRKNYIIYNGDKHLFNMWLNHLGYVGPDRIFCGDVLRGVIQINGVPVNTAMYQINTHTCAIFKKVVCIGDSFTDGYIWHPDGYGLGHNPDYAWPYFMSKITGENWVNCGISGATTETWLSGYNVRACGLTLAQEAGKAQAYVVGLMINDASKGYTVGTIDDVGTSALTYYGRMSAIIDQMHAINPDAHVFIQTCPREDGIFPAYNSAVYEIVEHYRANGKRVHCLDLLKNHYLYSAASVKNDALANHYTALGYQQFAEALCKIMSDYINSHVSEFQSVAYIDYD